MTPDFTKRIAGFPPALRSLVEAELAAGNEIVEIASCFPAPPAGAYVKLANKVSSRPRASGDGLDFYERNSSIYSGEFTDAKRFYFVIEPPNPPPPVPDMDAIRAAHASSSQPAEPKKSRRALKTVSVRPRSSIVPDSVGREETVVERFRKSMVIDYEKWHDGIGYDLEILKTATPAERLEIEQLLLDRGVNDWRDVEALAALDSSRTRTLLRQTLKKGKGELATAVLRYAPDLASKGERTGALIAALESAEIYGGLSQALLEVESFHPQEVIDTLLRCTLTRPGDVATHYAAMLMFLHGKAQSSFDWDQRPFFLRFNTPDRSERTAVFLELCEKVGVAPERYTS